MWNKIEEVKNKALGLVADYWFMIFTQEKLRREYNFFSFGDRM